MKAYWKTLLVAMILAMNPFNLIAQEELKLHVYCWRPVTFPTTNILVSWDGPCGTYTVLTNGNLNTTNWGVYSTFNKVWWLNQTLSTIYTIGDQQLFFKVTLVAYEDQTGCQEPQVSIITQPQDQEVYTNQTARFNTYTIGPESREHQWFFEGVPITGATNMTLTIPEVTPADEGDYHFVVNNSWHSLTSQVATLTVVEEAFSPTLPEPSPPPMSSSSSSYSTESLIMDLIFDPYAEINPIIQGRLRKLMLEPVLK